MVLKRLKNLVPASLRRAWHQQYEAWDAERWFRKLRKRFREQPPVTLNDKIQYKMAWDRRPLLPLIADKHAVRQYVADRVGDHILNEIYQVVDNPRDIDLAALPDRFVVKPTHGSAAVIIVHDQADASARIPEVRDDQRWMRATVWVRKENIDPRAFHRLCQHWLNLNYCQYEWAYRDIPHRLVVEKFLECPDGDLPRDYKLRVYHGKVAWMQAHCDKTNDHTMSLHRADWSTIPVQGLYRRPEIPPERPACLEDMVAIAEALGAETDMVRVDLYEVGGKVIFGELTNYPAGGTAPFSPPEYNTILAEGWEPPDVYR